MNVNPFFMMMAANAAGRAAPTYTPVAFLESTGTQWIDTGVVPDFADGDEIEIHYYSANYTGAAPGIFGSRDTGVVNGVYALAGSVIVADANGYNSAANLALGENVVKISDSAVVVNGASSPMPRHVTCARSMYLFALDNAGTADFKYPGLAVMEWTYRRNGHVVQHLVPALDANNVPCMWDTVTNTPLYNAGTGEFITSHPVYGETGVWLVSGGTGISGLWEMSGASIGIGQVAPLQAVYLGGVANSTQVLSGGTMNVSSGGVAGSVTACGSGARVYVSRGGTANGVEIYSSARVTVFGSNASASNVAVRGPDGFLTVYGSGAGAGGITMSGGAYVIVYQGATLSGINQLGGNLYVSSAGTATGLTMSGGAAVVYPSGTATDIVVSGGYLRVQAGGVASSVEVAGSLTVSSGGTALDVTSKAGAVITVSEGGYITYA